MKSKATGCGSISTVFSRIVLLCVSIIIITTTTTTTIIIGHTRIASVNIVKRFGVTIYEVDIGRILITLANQLLVSYSREEE